MSLNIDSEGTVSIYEGDTGYIDVSGLNPEKNYYVWLAIRDRKRNLVGEEIRITSNNRDKVSFFLSTDLTDLLTVPKNKQYELYFYGIKISEVGSFEEDTLFVGDKDYGETNLMIVYPKQVEGN